MKVKITPGYVPNPHYSQADWDEVSDNPEWTADDFARAKPARDVLPPALYNALVKRTKGQRGPQKAPVKAAVSLRLDREIVEHFKAGGPGWQSRINEVLKKAI